MLRKLIQFSFILSILVVILFSGCGGGGGGGDSSQATNKAITAFSLNGVVGTINETNKTIVVTMPFGTNITSLVATFTTTGSSVKIADINQTSGATANNFSGPLTYTVVASDGTTANYSVTSTAAVLTTITISSSTILIGSTTNFSAIANYSDNLTASVTAQVNWVSSNVATATISTSGIATIHAQGTTSISATLGGITSNSILLVPPMVGAGPNHTMALKSDSTVWMWGYNFAGELGDGTTVSHSSPVAVPGLNGVVALSTKGRGSHIVALKSDGTVWTWGWNQYGQLGDGTTTNRSTPVAVPGLTGVVAISAGFAHTVAIKSDGTLVAWGKNTYGELGDGTTTNRLSPVAVTGLTGIVAVALGSEYTVAVKSDGSVVAWGYNYAGQLGDGTVIYRSSPVVVTGLTGVAAIAAGDNHTVALKSDGTVMAWGYNFQGQLGDGTTTDKHSPVVVTGLTGVAGIAAGYYNTAIFKTDGTVLEWGYNNSGQLGDGTTGAPACLCRSSPQAVTGLTGIIGVGVGDYHAVALKSDGTVWTWGVNGYGELGDGTTTNRLSPIAVPGLGL